MVGLLAPSKSMRTMKSLPWLTTQHLPVAVGAVDVDRHRREHAFGVVADLRVEQAGRQVEVDAAVHVEGLIARSRCWRRMANTDMRLCTLRLKRSGGSGEAAELGTKPRPSNRAMLCSMFGNAPVGCATVPSTPPSAKIGARARRPASC